MMSEITEIIDLSRALYAAEICIGFLSSSITQNDTNTFYKIYLEQLDLDVNIYLPSKKVSIDFFVEILPRQNTIDVHCFALLIKFRLLTLLKVLNLTFVPNERYISVLLYKK